MTITGALALGLALGARHAADPDHITAVLTLLGKSPRPSEAARLAALWGLGHMVTFLAIGTAVTALGWRLPEPFEQVAELGMGAMLIAVGLRPLFGSAPPGTVPAARPVGMGLVHGMGGSAGVALLALGGAETTPAALTFLIVFAAGTVAGMVGLTVAFAWPLARRGPRAVVAGRVAAVCAGAASVALGATYAAGALVALSKQ